MEGRSTRCIDRVETETNRMLVLQIRKAEERRTSGGTAGTLHVRSSALGEGAAADDDDGELIPKCHYFRHNRLSSLELIR